MKLSQIKQIIADNDLQLTKSLGQNFLHDGNQLRRIVELADLHQTDKVLEIGPGLGPLTERLVDCAGCVLAIEKDARLVRILQQRFTSGKMAHAKPRAELLLVQDDALEYLKRQPVDWSDWKLVANLPYSVASPILVELALSLRGPVRMVATLQLEVAKRLMAKPGGADYGLLTLLVQIDYEPIDWFKIPATCFFPEPDVDSACVALVRRPKPFLTAAQRHTFTSILKRSFSQRRKMMVKLLRNDWPADLLEHALAAVPLDNQTRAEAVSLDQFVALTRVCMSEEIFDVVNEQDEVVGQKPRSEVHRLGLLHRAAHILVFNSRGEVFLQKRSMTKDRQPGLWDSSASGHVDSGESYDACAIRELREEIGLSLSSPPERLFKFPASVETDQEHVWVYRCNAEGPFVLHPDEIESGGWFATEAVTRWMKERPEEFATALLLIWPKVNPKPETRKKAEI